MNTLHSSPACRLYGITPDHVPAAWIANAAHAAFAAGLRVLQLRSKHLAPPDKRRLAIELLESARVYGAVIIMNDDMRLAADIGAHGVHLGGSDGDIATARALLGKPAIIGVSCYNSLALAEAALAQGASYVAFGALFASQTKPYAPRADLSLFKQAALLNLPMVGIGGVTLANAGSVIDAGASAVAVINELFPPMGEHSLTSYAAHVKRNTQFFLAFLPL